MENQLKAAIKEIKRLQNKYDTLYREFSMMKFYSRDLENKIKELKAPTKETKLEKMMAESKAAMERYTEKLRKENLKYAKQKQS